MTHAAPRTAETYALLTDGRTVRIRPARPSDRAQVRALYEGMWPETLKRRFFGAGDRLHEREVDPSTRSWPAPTVSPPSTAAYTSSDRTHPARDAAQAPTPTRVGCAEPPVGRRWVIGGPPLTHR